MFIKKRKITKASIDELAKRYPQEVISDEDARNIVGGTLYFSESGLFLAQVGSGTDIRVCSAGYSTENLNGWGGSIEDYYAYQHQFGHPKDWVGGVSGNLEQYKQMNDGTWYNSDLWEYDDKTDTLVLKDDILKNGYPYVPPYQDHFEGCCKSFDYGALKGGGMPMPVFMAESRSFSEVDSSTQARIREANPHLFTNSGGDSGSYGGSGSY